jgi:hypothetical protein
MEQKQTSIKNNSYILVRPFEWGDWHAMWKLQSYHLAEHGVFSSDFVQGPPDFDLVYDESNPMYPEMDMERIDLAYLNGKGNFWISWIDDQPVGMVGAQDMGDFLLSCAGCTCAMNTADWGLVLYSSRL